MPPNGANQPIATTANPIELSKQPSRSSGRVKDPVNYNQIINGIHPPNNNFDILKIIFCLFCPWICFCLFSFYLHMRDLAWISTLLRAFDMENQTFSSSESCSPRFSLRLRSASVPKRT